MRQTNLNIKLREKFIKQGVKMIAPETVFFSKDTKIGKNVIIEPYVVFGKKVKEVALLAQSLIRKDLHDPSTVYFAAEKMVEECEKGPVFDPKFIFYKTKNWKDINKKSQQAFEFLIKNFKKIFN